MNVDKEAIRLKIASQLGIEPSRIGDSDNFVKDLAMSSLTMLDCISEIEDMYEIRFPTYIIHSLNNLDKIVEYLQSIE